jgi:hypothetical protein
MDKSVGRLLFWAPRILGILFAVWISVFALDVFGEGFGFWGTVFALMMHLIPTALVVVILVVAWRWEWVGAVVFGLLGLLYTGWAASVGHLAWSIFISGPLFLVAILFWLNWRHSVRRHAHT